MMGIGGVFGKRSVKGLLIYILVFFIAFSVAAFLTVRLLVKSGKSVPVPQLVGKDVVTSLEKISRLGLFMKIEGFRYSEEVPKNAILRQSPPAGTMIREGATIKVILSQGSYMISVPDLKGMSLRQAEIICQQNELEIAGICKVHHDIVSKDEVIAQYPPPGRRVPKEEKVKLLVSDGRPKKRFVMPDLVGRSLNFAALEAEDMGLALGAVKYKRAPKTAAMEVLEQQPKKGFPVEEGDILHLVVSTGEGAGLAGEYFKVLMVRVPPGFLRRKLKVLLRNGTGMWPVYEGLVEPGRSVRLACLLDKGSQIFIFMDGERYEYEKKAAAGSIYSFGRFFQIGP